MSEKAVAALTDLLNKLDHYKQQMNDADITCKGGKQYYEWKNKYENESKRLHEALRFAVKIIKEK